MSTPQLDTEHNSAPNAQYSGQSRKPLHGAPRRSGPRTAGDERLRDDADRVAALARIGSRVELCARALERGAAQALRNGDWGAGRVKDALGELLCVTAWTNVRRGAYEAAAARHAAQNHSTHSASESEKTCFAWRCGSALPRLNCVQRAHTLGGEGVRACGLKKICSCGLRREVHKPEPLDLAEREFGMRRRAGCRASSRLAPFRSARANSRIPTRHAPDLQLYGLDVECRVEGDVESGGHCSVGRDNVEISVNSEEGGS